MRVHGLLFVPMVVGCAAPGADVQDAETATTTRAVLVVERVNETTQSVRAQASARFVRVVAGYTPSAALSSVGAGLDLPAAGACMPLAALGASGAAPVAELLDVGSVSFEANGVSTRLLPRQLPDVTDVVSGVVYARAAEPSLFPAATDYTVHIAGAGATDSLDLPVSAPADPANIRVASQDGDRVVATGTAVVFDWPEDGDQVYADVAPSGTRCLFDASGHGAIPSAFFDDAGTISVHRLRREAFRARGIDGGEIRFDFSRSVAYVRQ
jgi:hypothetical protein